MGKVRIASFGDEEQEQKDAKKKAEKKEQKKMAQNASEGIANEQISPEEAPKTDKKNKTKKKTVKRIRSKSYGAALTLVDRKNKYKISEALDLLEKLKRAKFDETVELHINTVKTGQFGNIMLPYGTGKQVKVAIADDDLIAEVEKGKINFDILLAEPEMMPKLARIARFLGPKGLMPNPKNGTVTKNAKEAIKQFEAGQLTIKSESKFPIVHLMVGKSSFGKEKLSKNIEAVLDLIKPSNITSATLKSTMSPGVKIQVA